MDLWEEIPYSYRGHSLTENTHCFATDGQNLFFNEGRKDCNATAVYNTLSWPHNALVDMSMSLIQSGFGLSVTALYLKARLSASNIGETMLLR